MFTHTMFCPFLEFFNGHSTKTSLKIWIDDISHYDGVNNTWLPKLKFSEKESDY